MRVSGSSCHILVCSEYIIVRTRSISAEKSLILSQGRGSGRMSPHVGLS